ncbi:hypothetical protein H072_6815 [Dactylellina haptotyla CBS 200.50]|uniref:Uncharacterized protein n=1 Tax=Dactylellina haptotyla (strain CBS 200.50) TaxID=1284197 RepID=S8BJC6_DACHA|nr:hypothetical protein H072_6815 [Dactylellina haptotyla CBS 200.50]
MSLLAKHLSPLLLCVFIISSFSNGEQAVVDSPVLSNASPNRVIIPTYNVLIEGGLNIRIEWTDRQFTDPDVYTVSLWLCFPPSFGAGDSLHEYDITKWKRIAYIQNTGSYEWTASKTTFLASTPSNGDINLHTISGTGNPEPVATPVDTPTARSSANTTGTGNAAPASSSADFTANKFSSPIVAKDYSISLELWVSAPEDNNINAPITSIQDAVDTDRLIFKEHIAIVIYTDVSYDWFLDGFNVVPNGNLQEIKSNVSYTPPEFYYYIIVGRILRKDDPPNSTIDGYNSFSGRFSIRVADNRKNKGAIIGVVGGVLGVLILAGAF